MSRYPQRRQEQLRDARQRVLDRGMLNQDLLVKCFLKMETSTSLTDPRNISPRSDEFLSTIGPYISAVEHELSRAPFLVKCMDLKQRDSHMQPLADCHTFGETDYSRFDMTISEPMLRLVQDPIILSFFPGLAEPLYVELSRALHSARKTHGVSSSGLAYNVLGTRCSGDAHTSIGNGLVNHFNMFLLYSDVDHVSWHEGDDGIYGLKKKDSKQADRSLILDSLGFKVKVLITTNLSEATFCGRFFSVGNDNSISSYADPLRTLAKFHITLSQGDLPSLLLAKALSYRYTDSATPILGTLCHALIHQLRGKASARAAQRHVREGRYLLLDVSTQQIMAEREWTPPTEAIRVAFALRTGINPHEQVLLERAVHEIYSARIPAKTSPLEVEAQEICGHVDRLFHYMPTQHSA